VSRSRDRTPRERDERPAGSARRALSMATLGANVAGSYLGYLAQRLFLDEAARKEKLSATHRRAARRVTDSLGALRGPAMKLGQTLSLQQGLLPDEMMRELTKLQMQAPPMHPTLLRAQFRGSMGAAPEEVFREFDPTPFAAASLGQVHRAVTTRGASVAVKVQYPGIRQAIENDFKWFRALSKAAQTTRHLPKRIIDDLEAQILSETDYALEADNLEFFAKGLRPLGYVTIPRVYRELSRDRVLTMSLLDGEHIDAFLARKPSQELRDLVGERLFELHYFQVLRLEAFHADPHWGNYLFTRDGGIGLVDFGCVKRLPEALVSNLRSVFLYEGDREGAEFKRLLEQRYALYGEKLSATSLRVLVGLSQKFYGVVYPPGPEEQNTLYDFSNARFINRYVRETSKLVGSKGLLPEYTMMGRAEVGLYQTLVRLKARVRTSRIVRRYLGR
jgi:predicted unusual protein kinase regulating ubiquinone biosynthesis (AarF/ABC1/UbiB family)